MSGRDTMKEMQSALAKIVAQSFNYGTEAALWSANRVLDAAEVLADAAAPETAVLSPPDKEIWGDKHLDRLRLPPVLFTIDLLETGRVFLDLLSTTDLEGLTPEKLKGLNQHFKNGDALSENAHLVFELMGIRGKSWYVFDLYNPRGNMFGLQKKRGRLRITPVWFFGVENLDPSRLKSEPGKTRNLRQADPKAYKALKDGLAETKKTYGFDDPHNVGLTPEATIQFIGEAGLVDPNAKLGVWRVLDEKIMLELFEKPGGKKVLEGLVFTPHFDVAAKRSYIEDLDHGDVSDALISAVTQQGYTFTEAAMLLPRDSTIRWLLCDPGTKKKGRKREYNLINGGSKIMVFKRLPERDQYVDPIGDRVAEHFLQLADPEKQKEHLFEHYLEGDIGTYVSEAHILSGGEAHEVLSWLRGQQDRIEPVEGGTKGSLGMIRHFFDRTAEPPAWVDKKLLTEGEEAFDLYKIPYMTALLFGALPQTYACWKGAQVLTTTGRLAIDPRLPRKQQMKRLHHRVAATAQFVLNIMQKGAFEPDGIGMRTTQTLRLLHAGVRFVIRNEGPGRDPGRRPWHYERYGRPINQEDMLGTMLAFAVVTFDKLHMLNVTLSDREEEALFHRWKLMGYYLGIREDLLQKLETVDDGRYLFQRISERQQKYEPECPNIREAQNCADLTTALIEYTRTVTAIGMPAEMAEYLVRYMAGRKVADRLGVSETDMQVWARAATMLGRANFGAIQILKDNSQLARAAFSRINEVVYRAAFDTWVSDEPVTYYRLEKDDEETDSDGEENEADAATE